MTSLKNPYAEPHRGRPASYIELPKKITKKDVIEQKIHTPPGVWKYSTLKFIKNPGKFLEKTRKTYGAFSAFFLYNKLVYLIDNPEDVHAVLTAPKNTMLKGFGFKILRLGLGEGLLTSEEPIHLQHKRIIAPLFHKDNIENYVTRLYDLIETELEKLEKEVNPLDFSMDLSLKIITELLVGNPENENVTKIIDSTLECMRQISAPVPNWRRYRKAVTKLNYYVDTMLNERRWLEGKPTILGELIAASDLGGGILSRSDLNDELQTLIVTGYETSASVLAVSLMKLSSNPEIYEKLQQEAEVTPWVKENRVPEISEVLEETYSNFILNETMRTHPPGWFIPRLCATNYDTPNLTIRKGTQVFVSPYVSHHNPEYFPEPEKWDPSRWANGLKQELPKGVYYPFGGGGRMCIGEHLSILTLKITLLKIAEKYNIKPEGKEVLKMKKSATYHPVKTSNILIQKR